MESENLHQQYHHQLQQQIGGLCSSLATQSGGCGVSTISDWSPSIIPNVNDYNTYMNEILPNSSREYLRPKNANLIPNSVNTSNTIQSNIGFYDDRSFTHQPVNTLQLGMMTELEISECVPKFSDMIHNQLSSIEESHFPTGPFSYGGQTNGLQLQASERARPTNPIQEKSQICAVLPSHAERLFSCFEELYTKAESCAMFKGLAPSSSYNFGHYHPSTSISNLDLPSSRASSSLGLNLALDLLTSTNSTGGSCSQSSHDSFGFFGEEDMSLGQVHVEESSDNPSNSSNKASAINKEVPRTKRLTSSSEPKPSHDQAAKKSRLRSHSPCPPFKVRKEKLGDRIASLHRLVAPFGKTDTASVLTEAIGYIKFLQNQIQKLTVPYMKSPCNSHCRTIQGTPNMEDGEEELKQGLRTRGLCLAPLSFTSYVSADN